LPFLSSPLSFTLVYIWSRRHPETVLSFLGIFTFTAPYLPFVLLIFSLLIHTSLPKGDIIGIIVGHIFYFLEDVWPLEDSGARYLEPPSWWRNAFSVFLGRHAIDTDLLLEQSGMQPQANSDGTRTAFAEEPHRSRENQSHSPNGHQIHEHQE